MNIKLLCTWFDDWKYSNTVIVWQWENEIGCKENGNMIFNKLFWKSLGQWSCFSSVLFSHSVMSNSLQPHGLQHARLPCPSPTPRAYSDSYPSSRWCHPTISSSVIPFSSHLQCFPASGSFPMSPFFTSCGHDVLEFQLQHQSFQWYSGLISFRMDWLDRLVVLETLKSLLQHHSSKASILQLSAFFIVQLSQPYVTGSGLLLVNSKTYTK